MIRILNQLCYLISKAHDNGMTWEEIADVFGHRTMWAWDYIYRNKSKIIVDEDFVKGLRQFGYDLRIVRLRKSDQDG